MLWLKLTKGFKFKVSRVLGFRAQGSGFRS